MRVVVPDVGVPVPTSFRSSGGLVPLTERRCLVVVCTALQSTPFFSPTAPRVSLNLEVRWTGTHMLGPFFVWGESLSLLTPALL